jgi:hypothetical protein
MQAERSNAASGYDKFSCLRCDLVLSYRRPDDFAKPSKQGGELP